jgi:hypothetical protein
MNMGRINIEINDKILLEFRKTILDEKGSLRGETAKAVQLAMIEYMEKRGKLPR